MQVSVYFVSMRQCLQSRDRGSLLGADMALERQSGAQLACSQGGPSPHSGQ